MSQNVAPQKRSYLARLAMALASGVSITDAADYRPPRDWPQTGLPSGPFLGR